MNWKADVRVILMIEDDSFDIGSLFALRFEALDYTAINFIIQLLRSSRLTVCRPLGFELNSDGSGHLKYYSELIMFTEIPS